MGKLKLKPVLGAPYGRKHPKGGFVVIRPGEKPPKGRSYMVIDESHLLVESHRDKRDR